MHISENIDILRIHLMKTEKNKCDVINFHVIVN